MKKITKKLPTSQIRASVSSTVNEENRTVDLTWTTGSKGLRSSWGERYYEELSLKPEHVDLSRLNDGGHPLLAAHDDRSLDSVIGVVERVWLEGDKAAATVRFAKDPKSDVVFQKVKDGILRNVSVGYSVQEYTDVTRAGDEIPTYLATRWTPAELSIVPIGFDAQAKVRSDDNQTENEVEIITRSTTPIQETEMSKVENTTSAPQTIDAEALKQEAQNAERARVLEIRKAVKDAGLAETFADEYITRGTSATEARANIEMFAKYQKEQAASQVSNTVRVEIGQTDVEKKRAGLEQALLVRADGTNFKHDDASKLFAGKSLLRSMEDVFGRRIGESDVQLAKRVIATADLPLIMANVAEKGMQKRYELAPRTWNRWAKTGTLRNYKEAQRLRAGDFESLSSKAEGANYSEAADFGEEKEIVQLADYGKVYKVTAQALVNDDMSAIVSVINQGGVAAARLENKRAYLALKTNKNMGDGIALYHASHNNLLTTASIGEASFKEAFESMRSQTTVDGEDTLNLSPSHLVVGPALEVSARKFLAAIQPTATGDVNVFQGSVQLTVDAEIADDSYFFLADQNHIDTVILYRLEGQESPVIESRRNFDNDNLELKVKHTVAAEPMDWRGMSKCKAT